MNKVKLKDICNIKGRIGWKGYTTEDLCNSGPYVFGANEITSDNKISLKDVKHITREKYEESPEIMIHENDILVVKVGNTIGKVAILDEDYGEVTINPNCVSLQNIKVNPYYLYYFLCTKYAKSFLVNHATASAQPALSQNDLKELIVVIAKDELKIANVLKNIDKKIKLNNKINEELEKIAKTLYDYWFVQFDFPDENNRPYKSSGGAMVYNEELKREIPKGWEVKELREIAPISNEQLTPEEDVVYRYYSIPDYDRQGTYVLDYGKNIHSNKFVVLPCDVLVSKLNPRFCRVICAGNKTKMISSTEFVVFRCNTETNQTLIRSIAVSDSFRDFCIANATGSSGSHNRIRPDTMGSFKIPYKDSVCNSFKNRLSSVIQKLLLVTQEKRELSELRDFLLPMLLNGQVKVI